MEPGSQPQARKPKWALLRCEVWMGSKARVRVRVKGLGQGLGLV